MLKISAAKYLVPCHTKGCYNKAQYAIESTKRAGVKLFSICQPCALTLYESLKEIMPKAEFIPEQSPTHVTVKELSPAPDLEPKKRVGRPKKEQN